MIVPQLLHGSKTTHLEMFAVHTFVLGATVASLKHHKINTDWLMHADILLFNPSRVGLLARRGAAHAKAPIYCMSMVHEDRQCPRLLLLQPRWARGWFKTLAQPGMPPQSKPVWIKTPPYRPYRDLGAGPQQQGRVLGSRWETGQCLGSQRPGRRSPYARSRF